jgi:GNAT superfamily N-acetyltransferase
MNEGELREAARGWQRAMVGTVCDVVEPWEHGTVLRATRYPTYWNFNVVEVEGDPGLSAAELIAVADEKLADFEHRRVDFENADAAEALRPDFEAAGWKAARLVWMRHQEPLPPGSSLAVEEVDYDAVVALRRAWNKEDFPEIDQSAHMADARELSMTRAARVIASIEDGEPVGFAQLEYIDGSAEVTHAYVAAEHRGSGRGTALTRAAIEAAGPVDNLWITADDEDRPKQLYARLGFRPAWTSFEFLRTPPS